MLSKPDFSLGLEKYGQRTEQEYQWLIEDWTDEMDMEMLHSLILCVYKDGVKDGIELCRQLDTN